MIINKSILTVIETQQILCLNTYKVYQLIHSGALFAYKDEGCNMWKIPEQSINDYLDNRKRIYSHK